ncbi:helix-hairpin-helix domain-containing protein [bacterium]|nr:MAG: helix-hairpin-helix domain-containing protein [bacterium]
MSSEIPEKLKIVAFLVFLVLLFLIGYTFFLNSKDIDKYSSDSVSESTHTQQSIDQIVVDLSGAVSNPGVYRIGSDMILVDLIEKSGGFSEDVDKNYIDKNLNLARKLNNAEKIYIPRLSDNQTLGVQNVSSGLVNINTASDSDLDKLAGVGPATIEKWKDARPFGSINELVSKSVLSQTTFEGIKDKLTL